MEKFKCREYLTLAYMQRFYGKCKTKFQNIKSFVTQLGRRDIDNCVIVSEKEQKCF